MGKTDVQVSVLGFEGATPQTVTQPSGTRSMEG
jgi:hypothetical protein